MSTTKEKIIRIAKTVKFKKYFFVFFLLELLFGTFLPNMFVFAAGGICACYSTNKDCAQATLNSGQQSQPKCESACLTKLGKANFASPAQYGTGTEGDTIAFKCSAAHTALTTSTSDAGSSPAIPQIALVNPTLNIDIPTVAFTDSVSEPCTYNKSETCLKTSYLATYLNGLYKFLIGISVTIAVVMLMIGGLQYTLGAAQKEMVEKGKKRIQNAVTGLVLLLCVFFVLQTINPELILMRVIEMQNVTYVDLPADDAAPSEGQITHSKGVQCFIDKFGEPEVIAKSELTTVTMLGRKFKVHKMAAPAYNAVAAKIASSGYVLKSIGPKCPKWTPDLHGGSSAAFNIRSNANDKSKLSLHSFGVAVDLNSCANPNGDRQDNTCPHDIPDSIIKAFKSEGFGWGGDFKKHCDAMHFEWYGPCAK